MHNDFLLPYSLVINELKEAKGKIVSVVVNGNINDHASYKFFTGQIKAFQEAIVICEEIQRKLTEE